MKPDFNRKYTTIAVYAVIVVAVSAVIVTLVQNHRGVLRSLGDFSSLLTPFVVGFVVAYILNPVLNTIERRILGRLLAGRLSQRVIRVISLILTYIFAIFVLSVFFSIVIPQIASSVVNLAVQIPGWFVTAQSFVNELVQRYDLVNMQNLIPDDTWKQVMDAVRGAINTLLSIVTNAIPQVWQTTLSVTTGVLNFIIGIIISVYILLSKERFFAQVKKLLNALIPSGVVQKLVDITHQSHEIFSGFISGKLLDSCIIGLLCFAGMNLMRMEYAMLISVIVGVTNIIPYFGPFIGAVPSILILLIVSPGQALGFAIFVLVLQQLDGNVIGPKILGDSTGLSAFWVIFSITVFGSLMGVVGMFIGVPLFAVIYSLGRQFCEWRLAAKGMPTRTADYASDQHMLLDGREKKPRQPRSFPWSAKKK